MRISFTTAAEVMADTKHEFKDVVGYSHASYQILKTLDRMGFDTRVKDHSAPIGVSMGFPLDYSFAPNQYKIGYTAWESTELKDGWLERMLMCDELWATSSWTAEVFKRSLGREDIFVYPHGIDVDWKPRNRKRKDVFRFLHIGEPQLRKNGQLVVDAFIELFGNDPDYQLIMKCASINSTRIFHEDGTIAGGPDAKYSNIKIITVPLTHSQMIELYWKSDAMVYPTTGEGFGFIPLQAIATGMPVASTTEWAEYKDYITVPIPAKLGPSIYPQLHPGEIYNVTKEDVKNSLVDLVENYDRHAKNTFRNSFKVHEQYDWERVTEPAAERLKNIFKSRGL